MIRAVKQWLAVILTLLVIFTLFGIIFVKAGIVQLTPEFFMELSIVLLLGLLMKVWWYDYTEDKVLSDPEMKREKDKYFEIIDKVVLDANDLEKYLVILNQENKEHFIKNKIGSRTSKNLSQKSWWMLILHPSWRKLTPEQIGEIRYAKLYYRTQRQADRLKPIKSEQIMALSNSEQLYDARNHLQTKKRTFQIVSTMGSFILTTVFSMQAIEQIMLNWENVFKYVCYLFTITFSIAWTVIKAHKQTKEETLDYYSRLKFIVDKYATYKEVTVKNGKSDYINRIEEEC
jgi:hypothetical protein